MSLIENEPGAAAKTGRSTASVGKSADEAGQPVSSRRRTNSRRGVTDSDSYSYPPVEAVCRAFDVLRAVNRLRIAPVNAIFDETGIPKSTIVRMLETLMAEGYVARDNLCGGYRLTHRVSELAVGYEGVSETIEVSRPFAVDLTQRIKWPIGLGVIDGDAIAIQFWTGTISPWAHTNTVLGQRPDLQTSAMGRAYLANCQEDDREMYLEAFRRDPEREFDAEGEKVFRRLLEETRDRGYAIRDPRTRPYRTKTLAMPIFEDDKVLAVISISIFKTAIPPNKLEERIIEPLRATTMRIENALAFIHANQHGPDHWDQIELSF